MGLFKKPNRKFRQREARADSEDESNSTESPETKPKIPSKPDLKPSTSLEIDTVKSSSSSKEKEDKTDSSLPKATKLLSFHDEEDDGEVFKLKKSSYSRRLAKQREKERKKKEETSSTTLTTSSSNFQSRKAEISYIEEEDADSKSKDGFKILTGNDAEDMEVESEEEKEKNNPFKNVLQSGIIPDAATIYAMKKHRQMAREMGDFIPVEEAENEDESKSRLIRDDDNDRSDDDDEPSRLSFTVNTDAADRQKMRETFLSLQKGQSTELEKEDAAELDRWEREQIKKGVGVVQNLIAKVAPGQTPQLPENQLYTQVDITPYLNPNQHVAVTVAQPVPEKLLKPKGVVLTTADIKARLIERLSALKAQHEAHQVEVETNEKEYIKNIEVVRKSTEEGPARAAAYSLYQQMSGYVKDLVECLDLKVAHIDLLDDRLLDLYKQRAQKLALRRQLDTRDQSDEFATLSSEIMKGMNAEFLLEKKNVTDDAKLRRAAEREGRRMRRRKLRERQMIGVKHQDGMSSDDEEPDIDILKFRESKESILQEANSIFEDVVEDFGTLEGVMTNFERWKCQQLNSYCEAFVPLCLPKIFGIFVKLALLGWNPLEEERDFEKTRWFRQLLSYDYESLRNEDDPLAEDPDFNLLPGIMERVVLQKITAFIQYVWDPLSQKETFRIVRLIRDLMENYPTINGKSKQLQNCLKAATVRINKALDEDVFIPLYPKELLENRSLKALDFFQRQFWSTVKLLQNICSWNGIISEQPLQQFSLSSVLNRYIIMGLSTSTMLKDTIDKCKVIVEAIPKSWLANIKGDATIPLLKQFSTFLVKYVDSYYSQSIKKGIITEEIKDNIKEVVQMLISLESIDSAVAVVKKYSISGFKNI
ncbi:PAX3- and PAX7-binding protein 1 isoform X2 [Parasteatoda tepidariorum]|uniref:PAX3- and PAX7-binding protein 1 isoform X2 n=1 Tax=Parasteatoda tepidariorum TaxID=114398 RepID=UPI0039BC562E